ncbi:MAG: CRISPR-associated endoribonuclease Cas6 [Hydrogenothermaceae bacterium]
MRIRFRIKYHENDVKLRVDYRRAVAKLIKVALKESSPDLFEIYYGNKKANIPKPFTFSVNFKPKGKENDFFILENNHLLNIYLSSFDPVFVVSIYNGLLELKENPMIFDNVKHEIVDFFVFPERKFNKPEYTFKTLSPILVREIEDRKGKGFLSWENEKFIPNLIESINTMIKFYKNVDIKNNIDIKLEKMKSKPIRNYGGEIGNIGYLTISADPEVLSFIYKSGIGAKRSQGFGMLEVVE